MTVGELKALLAQHPDDKRLTHYVQDSGFDTFSLIEFETDLVATTLDIESVRHRHLRDVPENETVLLLTGI